VTWTLRLLESDAAGTYNLGGSEDASIRELAERAGELLGRSVAYEYGAPVRGNCLADITKIVGVTGYRPRWTLAAGLREVIREPRELKTP